MAESWLKCSACRTEIAFNKIHWVCSVSTCNRNRTRLVFCSVACWDSHVAMLRHRDAWAVEARAPTPEVWQKELAAQEAEQRNTPDAPQARHAAVPMQRTTPASAPVIVRSAAPSPGGTRSAAPAPVVTRSAAPAPVVVRSAVPVPAAGGLAPAEVVMHEAEREVLIVISKLKKYIKDRSGFNCSDAVGDALSEHVRAICDEAIRAAGRDERKTVLDRDVPKTRR